MTTTFSISRDDAINEALAICSAYDPSNPPSTADYTTVALTFNVMIKSWIKTVPMWKVEILTLPLLSGQNTYQIGPYALGTGALITDKVFRVLSASCRDNTIPTAPNDVPIDQLSIQEYEQFSSKSSLGVVNSMLYRPVDDTLTPVVSSYIQVYPTPSDNNHALRMVCLTNLNDVNIGTDPLDFPQECFLALCWNLAKLIAFKYSVPIDRYREIKANALEFYSDMQDWSQENSDSVRMMYDRRMR